MVAINLDRVVTERKLDLVNRGGDRELSKLISEAAFTRWRQVLGIIPEALKLLRCLLSSSTKEELVFLNLQERIIEMIKHVDAFIFLSGDFATLEALITFASWPYFNIHHKFIGLLNVSNFYNGLITFNNHAIKNQLFHLQWKEFFICAPTANELLDLLKSYKLEPNPNNLMLD